MGKKGCKWLSGVGFAVLSAIFLTVSSVYADTFYSGPGAGPNATGARCSNFIHGFIYVCPLYDSATRTQIDSVGGASWKIYPSSVDPYSVLDYHGNILDSDQRGNIMAPGACEGYDWYVVYSWDGRNRETGAEHVDYGPLNYGKKDGGRNIQYNDWNAISYSELSSRIANGTLASGTKITEADAKRLYRDYASTATGYSGPTTLTKDGSVAFFCSKGATEYYAISNVGSNNGYASTGIVKSNQRGEANASTVSVGVNGTANIRFSHNLFTSPQERDYPWQIRRSLSVRLSNGEIVNDLPGFRWARFFNNIVTNAEGPWSGRSNFTVPEGSADGKTLYAAEGRTSSDGSTLYLTRDDYDFTFKLPGAYTFCESLYGGPKTVEMSKVCVSVSVDGEMPLPPDTPGQPSLCESWEHDDYTKSIENSPYPAFGATFSRSGVRNLDAEVVDWVVSNGANFDSHPVYARPDQKIEFNHCYYPGVQKMTNEVYETTYKHVCWHDERHDYVNRLHTWENEYEVKSSATMPKTKMLQNGRDRKTFGLGDYQIKTWGIDEYTVETGYNSKAGSTLTESMETGSPQKVEVEIKTLSRGCCDHSCTEGEGEDEHSVCCDSGDEQDYYDASIDSSHYSDTAMVKVPYNYIIDNVDISVENDYVYAGETVNINSATFDVLPKDNSITKGFYATKVDGGAAALVSFVTGEDMSGDNSIVPTEEEGYPDSDLCDAISNKEHCAEIDRIGDTFNFPENTGGSSESVFDSETYNVFDVSAGKYYCVVAAVYPATSGDDTSMLGSPGNAGNNSWRFSAPSCVKVAKKPSMQVWGNSLYTNGPVYTVSADKRVVAGFHDFDDSSNYSGNAANSSSNLTVFGSWVEQSIVTPSDLISGLASGAATGNFSSNTALFGSRSDKEPLGGSHEGSSSSFCKYRAPLTFPNSCYPGYDAVGGNDSEGLVPEDKEKLISQFSLENSGARGDEIGYNYTEEASIDSITDFASQKMDGSFIIPPGTTWVINHDGDFTIDKDITYLNDTYTLISDIPKLIIYASGDIEINCDVSRVDAILIAGGDVNTCPDISTTSGVVDTPDSAKATKQLKIFGTVITNTLTANRIYGAASGVNSVVPAEIIDYDSSIYLWGTKRANVGASGKTSITYQTELPPRY